MTQRTHPNQADEGLRRVHTRPSFAARLLTEAAHQLTSYTPSQAITALSWGDALRRAHNHVLKDTPPPVANQVFIRAQEAAPAFRLGETDGEYALRLRAAAKGL